MCVGGYHRRITHNQHQRKREKNYTDWSPSPCRVRTVHRHFSLKTVSQRAVASGANITSHKGFWLLLLLLGPTLTECSHLSFTREPSPHSFTTARPSNTSLHPRGFFDLFFLLAFPFTLRPPLAHFSPVRFTRNFHQLPVINSIELSALCRHSEI